MTAQTPASASAGAAPEEAAQTEASAAVEQPGWDTIVAGAGIAGLTVAHDLAARGYRVLVLEAADRLGGTAARLELGGAAVAATGAPATDGATGAARAEPFETLVLDAGAESFATRGGAVAELAAELGLGDDVVDPNPAGAWLVLPADAGASRAVPLPKRTLLGIPSTPLAQDVIDALGWGGAMRAYLDRLMPVLRIGKDDALGPLVRRRMGQKVLDRLVAPLAGGVYSADPELLDVAVVAPGLNNGITKTGSLSGGVAYVLEERAAGAGDARPGSAVQGIRGGVHRIAERLAERARQHHAELRTGVRVQSFSPTETGWTVETDAGSHVASSLVVALPEREARRLLAPADHTDPHADTPTVELVTLVFPAGAIEGDPRGTGVLVAADATNVRAKAMTHATAKWAWLRDAAGGREVVRLSYGSGTAAPATAGLDDAAATELALEDARAIFGTELPQPLASARVRWHQGQPSSTVGGRQRQQALRDAAAAHDNLLVVGAAVAGTGLAQVVPDARKAALGIRREHFAQAGTPWTDDVAPEEGIAGPAAAGPTIAGTVDADRVGHDPAGASETASDDASDTAGTAAADERGEA